MSELCVKGLKTNQSIFIVNPLNNFCINKRVVVNGATNIHPLHLQALKIASENVITVDSGYCY